MTDLTDLTPGERPYHAAFRPRITRDDTPGEPSTGLWIVSVPTTDPSHQSPPLQAYFADVEEAREWASAGWRAVHELAAGQIAVTPVVTYAYDPADPASVDALRQWEATTGAALAESGISVVTRHWVAPDPVRIPAAHPSRYTPHDIDTLAGLAARETPAPPDDDRLRAARAQRDAEQQRALSLRQGLEEQGIIRPDETLSAAAILDRWERLRDSDDPADRAIVQHIEARVTPPGAQDYAGSQHGYLSEVDDVPGTARSTPWDRTWLLTRDAPGCYVLWRPTKPDRPAVFFDTDNNGRPVTGRPGWFATADAARKAAQSTGTPDDPVTVRLAERLPRHIRQAFIQRHPDALRRQPAETPPPVPSPSPLPAS